MDDIVLPLHEEPGTIGGSTDRDAWKDYNLLSLDGGGIRGYWSLLVLQLLMTYIAEKEENELEDALVYSSFHPEVFPPNVSHVPPSGDEKERVKQYTNHVGKQRAKLRPRRYLPCHYFDYICGSSTGALIAIMLGRLRMTVLDCIKEYENLGGNVFGKPRFFTGLHFPVITNRAKYDADKLKDIFENVTRNRDRQTEEDHQSTAFPSERDLCRTFVTTFRSISRDTGAARLHLIRSYDHTPRNNSGPLITQPRRATERSTRSNTGESNKISLRGPEKNQSTRRTIKYGIAHNLEIWQVARAATAAPWYFDRLKIKVDERGSDMYYLLFTDGGFDYTNNPTKEGVSEIKEARGPDSVNTVVSIGTARYNERQADSFRSRIKGVINRGTDPERIHADMVEDSNRSEGGFSYYRLNAPGSLDVELDEWKPRAKPFGIEPGIETLNKIRNAFNEWASLHETIHKLTDCAADLVERRKARTSDRAQWERYATGAKFVCYFQNCEEKIFHRGRFEEHLALEHGVQPGLMSQVVEDCKKQWRYPPAPNVH